MALWPYERSELFVYFEVHCFLLISHRIHELVEQFVFSTYSKVDIVCLTQIVVKVLQKRTLIFQHQSSYVSVYAYA